MDSSPISTNIHSSTQRTAGEFADLVRPILPDVTDEQVDQLLQYRDLLHTRNQRVNLTAVRDFDGIERRLILESLRLTPVLRELAPENANVMDLGSGGGIPGILLAITLPHFTFTLLDATGKKVMFQRDVIESIGLTNVTAVQGRAENWATKSTGATPLISSPPGQSHH